MSHGHLVNGLAHVFMQHERSFPFPSRYEQKCQSKFKAPIVTDFCHTCLYM